MKTETRVEFTRSHARGQVNTGCDAMPGGVIMQNIQQWKDNRKAEAERKAAYMANLKLPFAAEYGEHKVKQGDIYALVVHTERYNPNSDFMVKYYTVVKRIGRLYLYRCDECGTIQAGAEGKLRREPTIKAYRKVA